MQDLKNPGDLSRHFGFDQRSDTATNRHPENDVEAMTREAETQQNFAPGEILFREGEASERVGRLLSGELDVLKRHAGQETLIGVIRRGEFFGEMGVLEGRPRSATLRARQPVSVEFMASGEFLRRVSADSNVAFELLLRLSGRLRRTDAALIEAVAGQSGQVVPEPKAPGQTPRTKILLLADNDRLVDLLPPEGHAISALPFFFGRVPVGEETPPPIGIDFTVTDVLPSRLATVHFALVVEAGNLYIKDFGTAFGTEVNGTLLGGDIGRLKLMLEPGETRIAAGGRDSPFVFRLQVG